jgi:hypothetical protein
MDFSMPSYDKLSDSKASVANVEGLAVELVPSSSKKGPDIAMEKKEPKEKKADVPRKSAVAEAIRDKNDEKITIVDMSLPSYTDSTASTGKSSFSF